MRGLASQWVEVVKGMADDLDGCPPGSAVREVDIDAVLSKGCAKVAWQLADAMQLELDEQQVKPADPHSLEAAQQRVADLETGIEAALLVLQGSVTHTRDPSEILLLALGREPAISEPEEEP